MFQTMIPAVTGIDRTHRSIEHNAGSNIFDAARFVPTPASAQPTSLIERKTGAPREIQRLNLEYDRHRHLYSWIEDSSAIGFNRQREQQQQRQQKLHPQLRRHASHEVGSLVGGNGELIQTTQVVVDPETPAKDDSSKRTALSIIKKLSPFDGGSRSDHSNSLESNPDQKKSMTASSGGSSKFRTTSSGSKSQHGGAVTSEDPLGELRWDKPLPLSVFVERYSLPKLVRINDSPVAEMLCRHLPGHADVTARIVRARNGRNTGRTIRIPRSYQGWFSLVSDRGDAVAAVHTTLMQLVRERVYKFVSAEPFSAYSETLADTGRSQYIRGMARAGQVYRLLAVFQDGAADSGNGSNKDGRGQYAQLLGDNQQVIYVSLSTKGKFYETSAALSSPGKQSQFDKDCVHRLSSILQHCDLPVNVKLLSGPLPDFLSQDYSDLLTLQSVSAEPMLVTCSLTENPEGSELQYNLSKRTASPDVTVARCIVGPDTEHRLYKSACVQSVLAFCQTHLDAWFRKIEALDSPTGPETDKYENILNKIDGLKLLKSTNFAKFLRGDSKHMPPHEKEDSIIFLSKHDLESMETDNMKKKHSSDYSLDKMQSEISSKMKVFEPSKRTKWFKHFKILNNSEQKDYRQEITEKYREFVDPFDPSDKHKSIERYQDMAKLIEERFGNKCNSTEKTSSVASSKDDSLKKLLTKSISVQTNCSSEVLSLTCLEENISVQPDVIPLDDLDKIQNYDDAEKSVSGPKTSFFTEKLCAEFHVKTKQLSKSTSSLNTILHFSVPQKMNVNELKKETLNESVTKATVHFPDLKNNEEEINNIQNRKLPEIDDLPYSTVRDRLENKIQKKSFVEPLVDESENIYAEICGDSVNFANGIFVNNNEIDAIILNTDSEAEIHTETSEPTSPSGTANKKFVSETSIKIQVGSEEGFVDTENITVIESNNCYSSVLESKDDTESIYNTLK